MPSLSLEELTALGSPYLPGMPVVGMRGFWYDADGIVIDVWRNQDNWELLVGMQPQLEGWQIKAIPHDWIWVPPHNLATIEMLPDNIRIQDARPIIHSLESEFLELKLTSHEKLLDNLHPRAFQDLMTAIYKNQGFAVEQIGAWNQADGGVDIKAVNKSFPSGELTLAIQCKCTSNKVSAEPIRSLSGVLDMHHAHLGVVATTSTFTAPAREEAARHHWRVHLEDRQSILEKLKAMLGTGRKRLDLPTTK
jgi:Restriction endonuclease